MNISVNMINHIELEAGATCMEHDGRATCAVSRNTGAGNVVIVSGRIFGSENKVHIRNAEIVFKGFHVPPDTRIMARDGGMSDKLRRYDLDQTPFAIDANVYLMFRISPSDYLLTGLLSWNIFSGKLQFRNNELSVNFHGDNKLLEPGQQVDLEDVVLIRGSHWQNVQEQYAEILAERHHVRPEKVLWKGWGSWDYYADRFGEREILDNYHILKKQKVDFNLIQIDDGYCVWGDWLDVKKDSFPDGIKGVCRRLANDGVTTGLWMAPFLAHKDSKLFAEHPDWFLCDGDGIPLADMFVYRILDYSLDAVCDWLYSVLRTIKESWGIKYFKLDFLIRGVRPCRSAVDGVTPLERFHRCFKVVKAALGDDVYILGCSADMGPCIGYVSGLRSGPDVSPQFSHIKKTVTSSISHWFMDKKVFHCDADYLVLRSTEDEESDHCGKANKIGTLSFTEAKTWKDFISVFGNARIAGDKLSSLRPERFQLLKQVTGQLPCDQCIPLDLWDGDKDSIPGCYLCRNPEEISLYLFNWNEHPVQMTLEGFLDGECLMDQADRLEAAAGIMGITIDTRSSKRLRYKGPRAFDELKKQLKPVNNDGRLIMRSIVEIEYDFNGTPVAIPLGNHARCPLCFDRLSSAGMLNGDCKELAEEKQILGIPFHITPDHHVIKLSTSDSPSSIRLDIGKKLKSLYILHCCEIPVKGYLNSYRFKYRDKTEEIKLIVGEHIGNSRAEYSLPWNSVVARIAWHHPQTDACLYLMEWHAPYPDQVIEALEITSPQQNAHVYIVGIAADIFSPSHDGLDERDKFNNNEKV